MINNYRVIRAYLSKASDASSSAPKTEITGKQAHEIAQILTHDPYNLRTYVRANNIDVNGDKYTELLLIYRIPKPVARLYVKAGFAPGVVRYALGQLLKSPRSVATYLHEGWLTLNDPGVKRAMLEAIKEEVGITKYFINQEWIKLEDAGVKEALLEAIKRKSESAGDCIDAGWLKPEDPGVRQALVAWGLEAPNDAEDYIDKGWITAADLEPALLALLNEDPRDTDTYIEHGLITPRNPGVKQALLEWVTEVSEDAKGYIDKGWVTSAEAKTALLAWLHEEPGKVTSYLEHSGGLVTIGDPGVKQALQASIKDLPGLAREFIDKGYLTQAEVDAVLKDRAPGHTPKVTPRLKPWRMWGRPWHGMGKRWTRRIEELEGDEEDEIDEV